MRLLGQTKVAEVYDKLVELTQSQKGKKRIALSAANDFHVARLHPFQTGDCNLGQAEANGGGNVLVHTLVRRICRDHEQHLIQRGFVPRNLGHLHMRAVDGVKRAAEQSDSHVSRPNPSHTCANAIAFTAKSIHCKGFAFFELRSLQNQSIAKASLPTIRIPCFFLP